MDSLEANRSGLTLLRITLDNLGPLDPTYSACEREKSRNSTNAGTTASNSHISRQTLFNVSKKTSRTVSTYSPPPSARSTTYSAEHRHQEAHFTKPKASRSASVERETSREYSFFEENEPIESQVHHEIFELLNTSWNIVQEFEQLQRGNFANNAQAILNIYSQVRKFVERYLAYKTDGGIYKLSLIISEAVAIYKQCILKDHLDVSPDAHLKKIIKLFIKIDFNHIETELIKETIHNQEIDEIYSLLLTEQESQIEILRLIQECRDTSANIDVSQNFTKLVALLREQWIPLQAIRCFREALLDPLSPEFGIDFSTPHFDYITAKALYRKLTSRQPYIDLLSSSPQTQDVTEKINAYKYLLSNSILCSKMRKLKLFKKLLKLIKYSDSICAKQFNTEYNEIFDLAVNVRNKFSAEQLFIEHKFENFHSSNNRIIKLALVYLIQDLVDKSIGIEKLPQFLAKLPKKHLKWMLCPCAFVQFPKDSKYFDYLKLLNAYIEAEVKSRNFTNFSKRRSEKTSDAEPAISGESCLDAINPLTLAKRVLKSDIFQ